MEFCPNCKAMLLPKDGKLQCSCGYIKDLSNRKKRGTTKAVTNLRVTKKQISTLRLASKSSFTLSKLRF